MQSKAEFDEEMKRKYPVLDKVRKMTKEEFHVWM